jgi:zinc transport system substrate-binding protein
MTTFVVVGMFLTNAVAAECKLKIGVTLHPYYSWVSNIVGDNATVTPLIPKGSDPHSYQPRPSDLENLQQIDVIIVNGQGHDEYVKSMLQAVDRKDLKIIDTSVGLPLIPSFGHKYSFDKEEPGKVSYNSHTYIAITGAIQQIQSIARELGKLCPDKEIEFRKNARAYSKRLRRMLSAALEKIDEYELNKLRIATVHDGYAYLMQELGIEVTTVIQPRHGIEPNPRQLQDTIRRIKQANVNILFTEVDYQKRYVDIIFQETGCRIYSLSHISNGEYSSDFFETAIQNNINDILKALEDTSKSK